MQAYCESKGECRRKMFHEKFGYSGQPFRSCGNMCDNCKGTKNETICIVICYILFCFIVFYCILLYCTKLLYTDFLTNFNFYRFVLTDFISTDINLGPVIEEGAGDSAKPYNENRKESLNTNYSVVTINDRSYNNSNDSYNNNNNSNNSSSSSDNRNRNTFKNNDNEINNDKNENNNGNYGNNTDVHKIYGNKTESVITTARPAFQKASSIIKNPTVGVLKPSTGVRTYFASIQKTDTSTNLKKDDDWMDCVVNENNSNSSNNNNTSISNNSSHNNNNNNNNSYSSNNNTSQNVYQNRMKRNNDEIEIEKQIRDSKIMASNISKKVRSSDWKIIDIFADCF